MNNSLHPTFQQIFDDIFAKPKPIEDTNRLKLAKPRPFNRDMYMEFHESRDELGEDRRGNY